MSRALVLGCFLVIGSSVSADQATVNPQVKAQLGALRLPESSDPYRTLFAPQRPPATGSKEPHKVVRCGMTILEADPMFDSKIAATLPKDGTKYTIRAVPPPICGAPR